MTPSRVMNTPRMPNANVWMYDESYEFDRVDGMAAYRVVLLNKSKEMGVDGELTPEAEVAVKLLFLISAEMVGAMVKVMVQLERQC